MSILAMQHGQQEDSGMRLASSLHSRMSGIVLGRVLRPPHVRLLVHQPPAVIPLVLHARTSHTRPFSILRGDSTHEGHDEQVPRSAPPATGTKAREMPKDRMNVLLHARCGSVPPVQEEHERDRAWRGARLGLRRLGEDVELDAAHDEELFVEIRALGAVS